MFLNEWGLKMKTVELFVGCGGLGLGASLAGFKNTMSVEWDEVACKTIQLNQRSDYPLVRDWNVVNADVRSVDYSCLEGKVDLLTGGPPCQPFSMGGKHRANADDRDMFGAFADALAAIKPRAFIVENVKGLTRSSFSNYLEYVKLRLNFPELAILESEHWIDHLRRLEAHKNLRGGGLSYNISAELLNAADYGAPQKRQRYFMVGFRSDVHSSWHFPKASHSEIQLQVNKHLTGVYWDKHGVPLNQQEQATEALIRRLQIYNEKNESNNFKPWVTIADAISDLPAPSQKKPLNDKLSHNLQKGARSYKGHTGSPIDLPAKTLKAGVHGVPGGENMLVNRDGSVRYFTIREAARMQTFPDGYQFSGPWSVAMRQLGNAVPVVLAETVSSSVARKLIETELNANLANSENFRIYH